MMERRQLLKTGFGAIGTLWGISALGAGSVCALTPKQPQGPFYPIQDQADKDADLIWVEGKTQRAQGQVVIVEGIVTDQNCEPVPGALVEIWQACATGKYNHISDPNPAPIDPNFQYWGKSVTNAEGKYRFRTIIPGAYPAGAGWIRPPHIHFKISKIGYFELVTQMYFAGDSLNDVDQILKSLPEDEQKQLIVNFTQETGTEAPTGQFNLSIRKVIASSGR